VRSTRNAAIVEAREVQITRHGQVVARTIPPERIPDCLMGWTPPAPAVATCPSPRRHPRRVFSDGSDG
jgi:antitoxin (DNA-binding transcriptional repressor) of toxin-antitoxin stability system